jgi:hypothetical protein
MKWPPYPVTRCAWIALLLPYLRALHENSTVALPDDEALKKSPFGQELRRVFTFARQVCALLLISHKMSTAHVEQHDGNDAQQTCDNCARLLRCYPDTSLSEQDKTPNEDVLVHQYNNEVFAQFDTWFGSERRTSVVCGGWGVVGGVMFERFKMHVALCACTMALVQRKTSSDTCKLTS